MEEICEVTYVEDFIDAVENVDDLARQKTEFLEMHSEQLKLLEKIQNEMSTLLGDEEKTELAPGGLCNEKKKEVLKDVEELLIQMAQVSDKGGRICDDFETIIESKLRTLNIDYNNLNFLIASMESSSATESDQEEPEEPSSDPIYCLCEKPSHGKMVRCDNDLCPMEWFHFRCVKLKRTPKKEWFCPRCRGLNSEVMKPKAEFFKELEEYNRKKEMENETSK